MIDGRRIPIEPSSAAWSQRHNRIIIVSDNYNELVGQGGAHFVIASFDPAGDAPVIEVEPLLTPEQAEAFRLYDLEGVTVLNERLFVIGSLALHGKDPARDRWERHQFVRMDLQNKDGHLRAVNLAHVAESWPDFRDWLISKSGYGWSAKEIGGRAEGDGINIEALTATSANTVLLGFRGPLASDGGSLVLEINLPESPQGAPRLVGKHVIAPIDSADIPKGAPKTLRGMFEKPGSPGEYYVLLGPKGYEKESIVLALWSAGTGKFSRAMVLPPGFVAEGIAPIGPGKILVVDDLSESILVASEN